MQSWVRRLPYLKGSVLVDVLYLKEAHPLKGSVLIKDVYLYHRGARNMTPAVRVLPSFRFFHVGKWH